MCYNLVNFHGYLFQLLGDSFLLQCCWWIQVGAVSDLVERDRKVRPQADCGFYVGGGGVGARSMHGFPPVFNKPLGIIIGKCKGM